MVVLYRVGWELLDSSEKDPAKDADPIDKETMKSKLIAHLKAHDGFLYNYRTPVSSVKSNCEYNILTIMYIHIMYSHIM